MKQFPLKRQLVILGCIIAALCFAIPVATFAKSASAPVTGGMLTSGKPVHGVVSTPGGVSYTFKAVIDKHVTLSITSPHISPAGTNLQMNVYNSSGNQDANGVYNSTTTTEIDF